MPLPSVLHHNAQGWLDEGDDELLMHLLLLLLHLLAKLLLLSSLIKHRLLQV
jgi:hypothetical protein